jgi:hypothetical protein
MVLGLMSFGATGARAEASAKWLILNSAGQVKTGAELNPSIGLEKDGSVLVMHTEILKMKVLFLCTEVKAVNAKLLAEGSIGEKAGVVKKSSLLFSNCTVDLNGTPAPECTPIHGSDGKGFIVSEPIHGLLILGAAKEELIKTTPDVGETYFDIKTPECPIGNLVAIFGTLNFKDCENLALVHLFKHLIEAGPGTELFAVSKTLEHTVSLLGSVWSSLTGEHVGLRWSGDPA